MSKYICSNKYCIVKRGLKPRVNITIYNIGEDKEKIKLVGVDNPDTIRVDDILKVSKISCYYCGKTIWHPDQDNTEIWHDIKTKLYNYIEEHLND